ncbi:hypothetical protein E0Z10_g10823, partial [Xylaria hypoxylon]
IGRARLILGSPDSRELSMVNIADCNASSQWMFRETSRPGYYRLHTVKAGTSRAVDVFNDQGTKSKHLTLTETSTHTGQFWRVDAWGDGFYRFSNLFTGEERHLDVYFDSYGPHLAPGNCIGQHWTLAVHQGAQQAKRESAVISSDLVQDLRLETSVGFDGVTQHTYAYSEPHGGQRAMPVTENWKQSRLLGRGGFGSVWLEACVSGPRQGELRAVKEVKKQDISADATIDYGRELQAVAKFSHRKNILVVRDRPNWWVKIADFGLSKRIEGNTALRTRICTPAYAAPEVLGIFTKYDLDLPREAMEEYSMAVDIWSLGSVVYRMRTGQDAFEDSRDLLQFVVYERPLFMGLLLSHGASAGCTKFIESCLIPSPSHRPAVDQLAGDSWLGALAEALSLAPAASRQTVSSPVIIGSTLS